MREKKERINEQGPGRKGRGGGMRGMGGGRRGRMSEGILGKGKGKGKGFRMKRNWQGGTRERLLGVRDEGGGGRE